MQSTNRLNRKLNLVIPVDGTLRGTVYVHVTPISREIFEIYFEIFASAHAEMYRQGYGALSGPRIASLLLGKATQYA